ncbi:camp-regulated phosphoprotein/endosulfine conserved region-domain-containing protein, partial [Peziza echinospora]
LSEDEQRLFKLYGKLPSKKDILSNKLKERKYFDSGDYALSKAGKASDVGVTTIGSKHPLPENIPHSHNPTGTPTTTGGTTGSPVKDSPLLHAKSPMGSQEPIEGAEAEQPPAEQSPASSSSASGSVPSRWQAASPDA